MLNRRQLILAAGATALAPVAAQASIFGAKGLSKIPIRVSGQPIRQLILFAGNFVCSCTEFGDPKEVAHDASQSRGYLIVGACRSVADRLVGGDIVAIEGGDRCPGERAVSVPIPVGRDGGGQAHDTRNEF